MPFPRRVKEVTGAFGISGAGMEFDSLDGAPVRFVVLFVVPKDQFQANLNILGTVAKFLNNRGVRERLADANSSAGIAAVLDGRAPAALPEKFTLTEPAEIALAKKFSFNSAKTVPLSAGGLPSEHARELPLRAGKHLSHVLRSVPRAEIR